MRFSQTNYLLQIYFPFVLTYARYPYKNDCPLSSPEMDRRDCDFVNTCATDRDCPKGTLCCFNGCNNNCVYPPGPPLAFDWTEETPDKSRTIEEAVSPTEAIILPGGCHVTTSQYMSLNSFTKSDHVKDCFCDLGNVMCHVPHEQ